MRSTLILAALFATAFAAPRPQSIDYDALDDVPDDINTGPDSTTISETVSDTVSLSAVVKDVKSDPASTSTKRRRALLKRDGDCSVQPVTGGTQFGGSPTDFQAAAAAAYPATNPSTLSGGYTKVFDGLQGSVNQLGYLGLTTINDYSISQCQALCDAKQGCLGFNLYIERDPSKDPGSACTNPDPITNYKCTLWGYPFQAGAADNTGETRSTFKVVLASSVAYLKPYTSPGLTNYNTVGSNLNGAINAPLLNGQNTYMGYKLYPAQTVPLPYFDPQVCATACDAQTAYNSRHHNGCTYQACNFFNAYVMLKDGKAQGMYCSLYSNNWDNSYAVNGGQTRSDGVYVVANSFTYFNARSPASAYVSTCL